MTVGELENILRSYDKTKLIVIDTLGFHRGLWPMADGADTYTMKKAPDGESYECVVLQVQEWP